MPVISVVDDDERAQVIGPTANGQQLPGNLDGAMVGAGIATATGRVDAWGVTVYPIGHLALSQTPPSEPDLTDFRIIRLSSYLALAWSFMLVAVMCL